MDDRHYDLVIIGTGSGNSLIGPEMDGWRIAIIEKGVFGGTCLNRGCIPTKMMVRAADMAEYVREARRLGVDLEFRGADWASIVERVFGRIDPIAEGGRQYRHSLPHVDVYEHAARFVGERALDVGGTVITGDQVVIAAGARSYVPAIPGLDAVPFHTSDSVMRLPSKPRHLVILGGGFIAAEMAHVFAGLGSAVTIINRSHVLLRAEDEDVAERFTELARDRYDVVLGATVRRVERIDASDVPEAGVRVHLVGDDGPRAVDGDVLLVALGRVPNGDELDCAAGGIACEPSGAVRVDAFGRTTATGVWALGDVNGRHQLKHMANGEARAVRHNLTHPDDLRAFDERPAPHAVFAHPQVGVMGLTEQAARERRDTTGEPYVVITQPYGAAAYGWAMEDTTGFCKLIGDPLTRRVLGAHVLGYQASMLVQLVVMGMHLGQTVDQMASGQVWIHPALSEVVEQALLALAEAMDAVVD